MYPQQSLAVAAALVAAIGGCSPERAEDRSLPHQQEATGHPRESEHPRPHAATTSLACGTEAVVTGRTLALRSEQTTTTLTDALAEGPVASPRGDRLAWTEEVGSRGATALRAAACVDHVWLAPITLVEDRGCPDRMRFSPEGDRIAYVSSSRGVTAVFAVGSDGGTPVQLTNAGLSRAGRRPGQAPAGFVPVPHDSRFRFEGSRLCWRAADGPHEVQLP